MPLGSVGVWQWRSFKAGTGPHGSGAATAPLQPAPDAAAAPLKERPRRTVPDSLILALGPTVGGGMAFATVKASHRVCRECRGA